MKNIFLLFLGILFTIAFSFTGIVLISNVQYGKLKPVAMAEGEDTQPSLPVLRNKVKKSTKRSVAFIVIRNKYAVRGLAQILHVDGVIGKQ